MSKVIWHQTSSGINLFYEGASLVISTDHPLFSEVKALISSPDAKIERLKEIVGAHKSQLDQERVESLLGLDKIKN
jgi:hypothetical protein